MSPAGRELLTLAAFKQGLTRRDLAPTLSFFHGVRVGADGALESHRVRRGRDVRRPADPSAGGRVAIANTAHPLDPAPDIRRRAGRGPGLAAGAELEHSAPTSPAPIPNTSAPSSTPRTPGPPPIRSRRTDDQSGNRCRRTRPRPWRGDPRRDRPAPAAPGRRSSRAGDVLTSSTCTATRPSTPCSTAPHDHAIATPPPRPSRAAQYLPHHRVACSATATVDADDDDRRRRGRQPRHRRRGVLAGVEHAALRPPHQASARLRRELPSRARVGPGQARSRLEHQLLHERPGRSPTAPSASSTACPRPASASRCAPRSTRWCWSPTARRSTTPATASTPRRSG